MILIDVNGQSLFVRNPEIVEESVKYLKVIFSFTKDWEGYSKTAFFKGVDGKTYQVFLEENSGLYAGNGAFFVPHEAIFSPGFSVSVSGVKDDSKITTGSIKIEVKESGESEGLAPSEPTPDVFSQISQMCTDAMNEARQMKEKADEIEEAKRESAEQVKNAKSSAAEAKSAGKEALESKKICVEARDFVEEKTEENAIYSATCNSAVKQISADKEECKNAIASCNSAQESCQTAKEETLAAKLSLEEGTEWIFSGGNAVSIKEIAPKILCGAITFSSPGGINYKTISFEKEFKKEPIVFLSLMSENAQKSPKVILESVGTSSFRLQSYNSNGAEEPTSTVFWMAIEQ